MVIATLYGYEIKGEKNVKRVCFQGQSLMNILFAYNLETSMI